MNKTLSINYYPVIDSNPIQINETYQDLCRISFNGISVCEPVNLALEQYHTRGWSHEKQITINTDTSNNLSFVLEQHYDGTVSTITGTTSFRPATGNLWSITNNYDWRAVNPGDDKFFLNLLKTDYEGFKFFVQDQVVNDIHKCEAGATYQNTSVIEWDINTPLEFRYEESGVTPAGDKFTQTFSYQIT